VLDAAAMAQLFDPTAYLGAGDAFVTRTLARHA
jgi:hypothetical protein